MSLPVNATEASRKRYELAVKLAESCPPELSKEIVLTGSTARGLADDDSDLELNLWSETIPSLEARIAWLEGAGVQDISVSEERRRDDSYWLNGILLETALEIGWQTFDAAEKLVTLLLAGGASQHLADIFVTAIPLRTKGRLALWQSQLNRISDDVQDQVIQAIAKLWAMPKRLAIPFRVMKSGERLAYTRLALYELNELMGLLYAINRRWYPSSKWTLTVARELSIMPERWRERIDEVLTASPEESIYLCVELMLDALALVPPEYDVSAAIAVLSEAKRSGDNDNL